MPTYCYVHPETEQVFDRVFDMGKAPGSIKVDGVKCERCFGAEIAGQGGHSTECWPMVSRALAVHPTQREEYMEFASKQGIPTDFDKMGRPIFRSQRHRKHYAQLVGATDFDGGYGDPHSD